MRDAGGEMDAVERRCTCHPDDKPPHPCPKRYAYHECVAFNALTVIQAITAPGNRTLDEMIRDMRYANDTARHALSRLT